MTETIGINAEPVAIKPVLVLSWGNPSRGDDAIGPQMTRALAQLNLPEVELLTDFQLQIEHCLDLQQRSLVYLVDASLSVQPPFQVSRVTAGKDPSFTSHAMTPAALLAACEESGLTDIPEIYLLEIKGYEFELGQPLTHQAQQNLLDAQGWLTKKLNSI